MPRCGAAQLVPAGRRDWVAAVWAEAPHVPPGLRRLAWYAGGAWLLAREALMRRGIGKAVLFAVAAAAAAWAAWPGSPTAIAGPASRVDVITVVVLAGLPLLARPVFGPPAASRAARLLRAGTCAGFLALLPALNAVEQFRYTRPHGSADLAVYLLVSPVRPKSAVGHVLGLVMLALYMAAIVWMTSRRARIAAATLGAGVAAGIILGLVMYTVAPLGLSSEATDPWLPGSHVDPMVLLAWLLLLGAPLAAAVAADRHYTARNPPPSADVRVRQIMAAGLLASLTGALSAIAYSHQLTGAADAGVFSFILLAFPVIALMSAGCAALAVPGGAAAGDSEVVVFGQGNHGD